MGCLLDLQANLSQALVQVLNGGDGRVVNGSVFCDARLEDVQRGAWLWVEEERNAEAGFVPIFTRRIHYTVSGGLEVVVGETLKHVSHVDDDFIILRDDLLPLSLLVL